MGWHKRQLIDREEEGRLALHQRGPKGKHRRSGSKMAAAGDQEVNNEGQGNAKTEGGKSTSHAQSNDSGGTQGEARPAVGQRGGRPNPAG